MRLEQPRAQFRHRRIRVRTHMRGNGAMPGRKPARRVRALLSRRGLTPAVAPLPGLDYVGNADPEPGRDLPRAACRGQNPIAQILRIRLPPPPRHFPLRLLPESHESHLGGESESPLAIPARLIPL